MPAPPAVDDHLEFIDIARGIAILMVVLVHTSHRVPGDVLAGITAYGQLGVQLFFVASAYTLSRSFARRSTEAMPIASFYLRRFFRIAPLYYLGIGLYTGYWFLHQWLRPSEGTYPLGNALANVFFVHGFIPHDQNLVPGGWSIHVEMVFYLLFPALFTLMARWRRTGRVAALAGVLAVNVVIQAALGPLENNTFRYFHLINQAPVFMVGVLYYFVPDEVFSKRVAALSFAAFTLACTALWKEGGLAFAVIPTLAGASFVCLLRMLKGLRMRVVAEIGRVSYSVYLFHFAVLLALSPIYSIIGKVLPPDVGLLVAFALTLGITYAIARWSQVTIEKKGISAGSRLIERIRKRSQLSTATVSRP